MVPSRFIAEQQRAVHVKLYSEVEGEGRTPVRVEAMAVRGAPTLWRVLRQFAIGLGEEVLAI
jgi:hypothetical protein